MLRGQAVKRFLRGARAASTQPAAPAAQAAQTKPLFDKILIANRGEISCRVSRTAHKMGIKTVAVYSDPDANAVHVRAADEAVCIGPALSSQSYLSIPKIMDAIAKTGAQAVHPGYGFLSENSHFVETLEKAGVTFIGPGTHAMEALGDKIHSKQLAIKAGVNTVPGFLGDIPNAEEAVKIAREIGYPVMVKASAGGGGKGMRVAYNDDEVRLGYRLSKDEAKSSFASDVVFIEKYIEQPRHIEIQLIADSHGNVVPLPERECTIQRRNQKVIEESPSTFLDEKTRRAMQEQAASLARAVGYVSAGTVEFLADKHSNFYFLEMNTRLQVEHPVTEMITGLDLVELMIRVAAGEKLPSHLIGAPVPILGHAFESRVYAEDPFRGFLPSTGRLAAYVEPGAFGDRDPYLSPQLAFEAAPRDIITGTGEAGRAAGTAVSGDAPKDPNAVSELYGGCLRGDAGVTQGSEISMFYDPMICKLITHAGTRDEALDKMRAALDAYVIRGVGHNVSFLRELCDHPRFRSGRIDTGFIAQEYPTGFHGVQLDDALTLRMVASAAIMNWKQAMARTDVEGASPHAAAPEVNTVVVTLGANTEANAGKQRHYVVHVTPREADAEADEAVLSTVQWAVPKGDGLFWDFHITPLPSLKDLQGVAAEGLASKMPTSVVRLASVDWSPDSPLFLSYLVDAPASPRAAEPDAKAANAPTGPVEEPPSASVLRVQQLARYPDGFKLQFLGATEDVYVRSPYAALMSTYMLPKRSLDLSRAIVSPMPGALVSLAVKAGDAVEQGQEVAVVEAMKMQNVLRSPKKGTVKAVKAKAGDTLALDQVIVEFD